MLPASQLHGMQWLALPEAVDHFSEFMHQQLDLRTEAYNLTRFIANFPDAASSSGSIVFPRPIEGFVTKHVLVETLLPGKPISCLLGRDGPTDGLTGSLDKKAEIDTRKRIARRGLHAFLKMVSSVTPHCTICPRDRRHAPHNGDCSNVRSSAWTQSLRFSSITLCTPTFTPGTFLWIHAHKRMMS